jgi:hypothetical protein
MDNQPMANQLYGNQQKGDQLHGDQPHGDQLHGNQPHGDQLHGDQPHGDQPHGDQLFIGHVTDEIVDSLIAELKKKKNKTKITQYLIVPFFDIIRVVCFPYILGLGVLLASILVLQVLILIRTINI